MFGNLYSKLEGTSYYSGNGSKYCLVFRGIGCGVYLGQSRVRIVWYLSGNYKDVKKSILEKITDKNVVCEIYDNYLSFSLPYNYIDYASYLILFLSGIIVNVESAWLIGFKNFVPMYMDGADKGLDYLMGEEYQKAFNQVISGKKQIAEEKPSAFCNGFVKLSPSPVPKGDIPPAKFQEHPTKTFKVGDKVKLLSLAPGAFLKDDIGKEFIIEGIAGPDAYSIKGSPGYTYCSDHFELAEEYKKNKFKPGDKVMVVDNGDFFYGREFTVEKHYNDGLYDVVDKHSCLQFYENQLESTENLVSKLSNGKITIKEIS